MTAEVSMIEMDDQEQSRMEWFQELGFSAEQAKWLTFAKDEDGHGLRPIHIEKLLKNGATHGQVFRIFT